MICPRKKRGTSRTGSVDYSIMLRTPKLRGIFGFGAEYLLYAVRYSEESGFLMEYRPSILIYISSSSRLQVDVKEGQWALREICSKNSIITLARIAFPSDDLLDSSGRFPVKLTLTIMENRELKHHWLSFPRNSPRFSLLTPR